jgi:hypothetical protein
MHLAATAAKAYTISRSGARYLHDSHQEQIQYILEPCGRADPPELYPCRADVKLGTRMLCMQPSVTLSVKPGAVEPTPSFSSRPQPNCNAQGHIFRKSHGLAHEILPILTLCDTPSGLQHPNAAKYSCRMRCQVNLSEISTEITACYGSRPYLPYHHTMFRYSVLIRRSVEM